MMTDWPATISAFAAAAGLAFSGWQTLHLRQDREEERRLWTEGVSVSWHPRVRPNVTDVDQGSQALWQYAIRVDNPGRFPISDVDVAINFEVDVERIEHGGLPGGVTRQLTLHQPVVRGGGHREWRRTLRVTYEDRDGLKRTTATVSFRDVDGLLHTTRWPRP
jgi:hypothetical protein